MHYTTCYCCHPLSSHTNICLVVYLLIYLLNQAEVDAILLLAVFSQKCIAVLLLDHYSKMGVLIHVRLLLLIVYMLFPTREDAIRPAVPTASSCVDAYERALTIQQYSETNTKYDVNIFNYPPLQLRLLR